MILFIVTETEERFRTGNWFGKKLVLEEASGDFCLIVHYKKVNPQVIRKLGVRAVVHSGAATPFEDYDVRETRGYRDVVLRSPVPQLGICGGHQLIAEFHGGTVAPMRKIGADDADYSPKYHPGEFKEWGVFPVRIVRRDPLFRGLPDTIRVQQFHRSEVKEPGPHLVVLVGTRDCRVQAFVHRRKPVYGVQFHPEEINEGYPDGMTILRNFFRLASARQPRRKCAM
jgi:GMP synthase-like glutamine amidotransferase